MATAVPTKSDPKAAVNQRSSVLRVRVRSSFVTIGTRLASSYSNSLNA
jgi:hypothetical protein